MRCPYCLTEIADGATRCPACTSWLAPSPGVREWTRPQTGRMLAGVCRGLANRFELPIAAVRVAFLLSLLLGGAGIVVYLALWIAMPEEPLALPERGATSGAQPYARPPAPPPPPAAP